MLSIHQQQQQQYGTLSSHTSSEMKLKIYYAFQFMILFQNYLWHSKEKKNRFRWLFHDY